MKCNMDCLNCIYPDDCIKEYNPEYAKNYYADHADHIKAYQKDYYAKHRDAILKHQKEYKATHKTPYDSARYIKNAEKHREQQRSYYQRTKEKWKLYREALRAKKKAEHGEKVKQEVIRILHENGM